MENRKKKNKKKVLDNPVPAYRLKAISKVMVIVFVLLVTRIGWIQFVEGAELKELASRQQTLNKIISPKRGTIYDANGKIVAKSAPVDTITINPKKIVVENDDDEVARIKTEELKKKVAEGFSQIFSLDYETVYEKVSSEKTIETIIKKVEKPLVDELKAWMKENEISSGINIDEDSKRYYPYNSLAAHTIGFTGTDSQGLFGIEHKWDSVLKGTSR